MDPITLSALIGAGTGLMGSLFGGKKKKEWTAEDLANYGWVDYNLGEANNMLDKAGAGYINENRANLGDKLASEGYDPFSVATYSMDSPIYNSLLTQRGGNYDKYVSNTQNKARLLASLNIDDTDQSGPLDDMLAGGALGLKFGSLFPRGAGAEANKGGDITLGGVISSRPGAGGETEEDPNRPFAEGIPADILNKVNDFYNRSNKSKTELGAYVGQDYVPHEITPGTKSGIGLPFSEYAPEWKSTLATIHTHPDYPGTNALPNELSKKDIGVSKVLYNIRPGDEPVRSNLFEYTVTPKYIIQYQNGKITGMYERSTGKNIQYKSDGGDIHRLSELLLMDRGGGVPKDKGIPGKDSIPVMASPGEKMLNAEASSLYGPWLDKMNKVGLRMRELMY